METGETREAHTREKLLARLHDPHTSVVLDHCRWWLVLVSKAVLEEFSGKTFGVVRSGGIS